MKLRIFAFTAALTVVAAVFAHSEPAADPVSGLWDVTLHVEGMSVPATFTLVLRNGSLSGSAYSQHTGAGMFRDGSFKDGQVAFTLDFASHESIAFTGALKEDQLSGEFRTEGRVGKWDAVRGQPVAHDHGTASR